MVSRDDHLGQVEAATQIIGEIQELISSCTDRADSAMSAVIDAVGDTGVESGLNAMNYVAGARVQLDEAHRALAIAADELRRYGDGF